MISFRSSSCERRVHLEIGVVARELAVGERDVMGRGLGRDAKAVGLGRRISSTEYFDEMCCR